ncbi:MAG TPA: hypothetical protein VG796_14390 [Verrucomicrobiales bacterium]|nr:hypothetical protein [Verrucomicrobiales bacterium]
MNFRSLKRRPDKLKASRPDEDNHPTLDDDILNEGRESPPLTELPEPDDGHVDEDEVVPAPDEARG